MDLQIKLVNDGYSRPFDTSLEAPAMPEWANWRNEVFGFTFEPAVIIYNKKALPADLVPTSHAHLAELLKSHPAELFGKVATYDPQRSGLGFLFVTQDEKAWPGFWSLVQGFGGVGVKLYSTSRPMIERVASGKFLIGYNILGSYALSLQRKYPDLGIVIPRDYALVMSRIAILPRQSPSPRLGERFLDFLLSREGQSIIAEKASLYSLHPAVSGVATAQWLRKAAGKSLRPIRVSPELLVYLDQVKRQKFLKRWEKALGGR
jgi:iron(III) transport system substrate-binding protein